MEEDGERPKSAQEMTSSYQQCPDDALVFGQKFMLKSASVIEFFAQKPECDLDITGEMTSLPVQCQ